MLDFVKHKKYMDLAIKASTFSTCYKREIGAVLVKDDKIIGMGHNGGKFEELHSKGTDKNAVGECYYEKLAKQECVKRNIIWGSTESLVVKKEFRLFCLSSCAERSAIYDAINTGHQSRIKGSTLYGTTFPCPACAHAMVRSGITNLFFINAFDPKTLLTKETVRIFEESDLKFYQLDIETTQGSRLSHYKESPKFYK